MYQHRDYEIIDYELFHLPGTTLAIRGPRLATFDGDYFVCLGAAQTFGCFCERPYPRLLEERLGLPVLNLGVAGAGPRYFLQNAALLEYVQQARFVIVQVMSARSEDNALFDSGGLEYLTRRSDNRKLGAEPAYRELLEAGDLERVKNIVEETRFRWIASFVGLLRTIQIPRVLLWFSERSPDYVERYDNVHGLFGQFPQLVTRRMVQAVREHADYYVECVTSRGLPQQLRNRFTGQAACIVGRPDLGARTRWCNTYYPAPEMHSDAADVLESICAAIKYQGTEARG